MKIVLNSQNYIKEYFYLVDNTTPKESDNKINELYALYNIKVHPMVSFSIERIMRLYIFFFK